MASARVAAVFQTMRILWAALFGSHLIFLAMIAGHFVHQEHGEEMPAHLPELLGALALGMAVFAVFFPARAFYLGLKNMEVATTNEAGEMVGSFRESAPVERVVADPEKAVFDALPRFQTPLIMGLAMAEAISLLGFMLGFMGAPIYGYLPFFALGMLLAASKFPRIASITRSIELVKGARCDFKL